MFIMLINISMSSNLFRLHDNVITVWTPGVCLWHFTKTRLLTRLFLSALQRRLGASPPHRGLPRCLLPPPLHHRRPMSTSQGTPRMHLHLDNRGEVIISLPRLCWQVQTVCVSTRYIQILHHENIIPKLQKVTFVAWQNKIFILRHRLTWIVCQAKLCSCVSKCVVIQSVIWTVIVECHQTQVWFW